MSLGLRIVPRMAAGAALMAALCAASAAPAVEVLLSSFENDLSTSIPGVSWTFPDPTSLTTQFVSGVPGVTEGTFALEIAHPPIWDGNPWIQIDGSDVAREIAASTALRFDLTAPQDFAWRQVFVIMHGENVAWDTTQTQFDLGAGPDTPYTVEFDLTAEYEDLSGVMRPLREIAEDSFDGVGDDWFQVVLVFQGEDNLPLPPSITFLDNVRLEQDASFEADFDLDGDVDGDDFLLWQGGFGTPTGAEKMDGDYDNDGDVDGDDFLGWQAEFGSSGSGAGSVAVPEPATTGLLAILAIAGLGLAGRRR